MGSPFGGGGGGGGGSETRTVIEKQTSQIPEYLKEFSKRNIEFAEGEIKNRGYEEYGGPRLADLGQDYQSGFDMVRDTTGNWVAPWEYGVGTTADVAGREVIPFTQADIASYMNPYMEQVAGRTMSELARQEGIERNQLKGQVASQGAYGGARHGVMEATHARDTEELRQNLLADLFYGGYSDAAGRFYADEQNRLSSDQLRASAGGQLGNMGAQGSQLGYADASAMLDIGERQRQIDQAGIDINYANFLREWNQPYEILAALNATAGSTPFTTNSQTEQQVYGGFSPAGGSTWAQGIGAFGALAGGIGGLASGFGWSSKALKENDAEPETILEAVKKLPVRAWTYKEETGLGTEPHIGPYAEDWRDTMGLGDGTRINYLDGIGVNLQATKELAEEVDGLKDFAAMVGTMLPETAMIEGRA